ncbi:hypothetical protein ACFSM7_08350 [Clavibacter michiganensis subsp. tessellarius]
MRVRVRRAPRRTHAHRERSAPAPSRTTPAGRGGGATGAWSSGCG